ncbi:MAG: GYD domain-containing protein [Chloroflexi bacterium]|nr:GYD domain-containing protein [Chloroflexota bacterium]
MSYYMVQVTYKPETWATLIKSPQNRVDAVRPAVEELGGAIHGAWFTFGEYDVVAILQLPDNVSAAALSMAFSAGGASTAVVTTPLLTVEEWIEAMQKAGKIGYRPPLIS